MSASFACDAQKIVGGNVSKGRVLIADDDPAIRSLLKVLVERAEFEADFAKDGAEAIEKLLNFDYLVLLLDLMMPRVNGYEVAQELLRMSRRPAVVVLTALNRPKFADLDGRVVHAILQKPFDINALGETILNLANDMLNATDADGGELIQFRTKT
jgi:DNA-binding response OmpR family regulator